MNVLSQVSTEQELATALNELQELMNENADLHKSCDFTLDNFDARQAALDQEMDGLREAKSAPELKGSIGEGPNHSNHSNSFKKEFSLENSKSRRALALEVVAFSSPYS